MCFRKGGTRCAFPPPCACSGNSKGCGGRKYSAVAMPTVMTERRYAEGLFGRGGPSVVPRSPRYGAVPTRQRRPFIPLPNCPPHAIFTDETLSRWGQAYGDEYRSILQKG